MGALRRSLRRINIRQDSLLSCEHFTWTNDCHHWFIKITRNDRMAYRIHLRTNTLHERSSKNTPIHGDSSNKLCAIRSACGDVTRPRWLREMMVEYSERRDYLAAELKKLGFEVASPDGAFYLFAKIPAKCGTDSWAFVRNLAPKAKVALIPGGIFRTWWRKLCSFQLRCFNGKLKRSCRSFNNLLSKHLIFGRRKRPYMVFFCFIAYILYRFY